MAFPEDEIAALNSCELVGAAADRRAERGLLHVAVARTGDAAGGERKLHQAGTIEAERGLAAPQIWRADKALGDRDEIGLILLDRLEMDRRHEGAILRYRHALHDARDRKRRTERQCRKRRHFD